MPEDETLLNTADNWDVSANPMTRNDFGVWEVKVSGRNGVSVIPHNSYIKVGYNHLARPPNYEARFMLKYFDGR